MAKISSTSLPLFPILHQDLPGEVTSNDSVPLSGIARMAAEGEPAGEGHLIEFSWLNARSILNRSVSKRNLSFSWTVNPYRGCEFGCRYCYARYTHEFMNLRNPEDFERRIFIKQNAAWLLEQELRRVSVGEEIAIGTATDPYQPIERTAKVTQRILEMLSRRSGLRLGLVTKSTLIERDVDLLAKISRENSLTICVTITTADAKLARQLEPRAPRPDLRLRTVARLRSAGLNAGVLCCPILPGITDTAQALDKLARKANAAGACFFHAQPLFLKSCSRPTYFDFIRQYYPSLEEMYRQRFGKADFVSSAYRNRIAGLVKTIKEKYDFGSRDRKGMETESGQTYRVMMTS